MRYQTIGPTKEQVQIAQSLQRISVTVFDDRFERAAKKRYFSRRKYFDWKNGALALVLFQLLFRKYRGHKALLPRFRLDGAIVFLLARETAFLRGRRRSLSFVSKIRRYFSTKARFFSMAAA